LILLVKANIPSSYRLGEVSRLVTINLGDLKDMRDDVAALLEEKLGVKPVVDVGRIVLEGTAVRARDVKLYLKKFLHRKGLRRDFRIFVEKGEVDLVALEREEEEE